MKWFKHDSEAHRDAKLKRIKMKYGMTGYGLYWYCLELIASNVDEHNATFEMEEDSEIISHDTGISRELAEEMMTYMVTLGLFEESNGVITCLKLAKRLDQSMTSNPVMRRIITQVRENHDGVMTESRDSHDGVMMNPDKVMQDKIRLDKNKKNRRFTPPDLEEVTTYCKERSNAVEPQVFIDHYQANGWMRGKNKIKDWKACVRTWEKNAQPKSDWRKTMGGA